MIQCKLAAAILTSARLKSEEDVYLELSLTAEFFRAMLRDRNYFGIAAGREQYISIGAALYICEHFLPPKLDVGLAMN